MLDIQNLERRWLKYKIKSYVPHLLILLVSLIVTIAILSYSQHADVSSSKPVKIPLSKKSTFPVPVASKSEDNRTVLEPAMEFVQTFEKQMPSETNQIPTQHINTKPIQQVTSAVVPQKVITVPDSSSPLSVPPSAPAPSVSQPAQSILTINRNESKLDIESLQRRFKETSNANLGLFIARYYYDQKNFNEAYNYALRTNTINNKIDESWIIFSKALVKLGKTEQAKKTLQLYISQSNSENAKILLDSIEKGSFK